METKRLTFLKVVIDFVTTIVKERGKELRHVSGGFCSFSLWELVNFSDFSFV